MKAAPTGLTENLPLNNPRAKFLFFIIPFLLAVHLSAQNSGFSLGAEISRLEKLSSSARPSGECRDSFLSLARLHRLSGNYEAALKAYEGALSASPSDSRALMEKAQLLISLGEHDKAAEAAAYLLTGEREDLLKGRLLIAWIEAFRSGNLRLLESLASDNDFPGFRPGILYTLWKLSGLPAWKTSLTAEFPKSPEAKIAGSANGAGKVLPAATPLWLFYPGRENVRLSAELTTAPAPAAQTPGITLQAGLFGLEENARGLAERLKQAGFESQIKKRQVNGSDYWAVYVPGGQDMNATIRKLKDAGFESFPAGKI